MAARSLLNINTGTRFILFVFVIQLGGRYPEHFQHSLHFVNELSASIKRQRPRSRGGKCEIRNAKVPECPTLTFGPLFGHL